MRAASRLKSVSTLSILRLVDPLGPHRRTNFERNRRSVQSALSAVQSHSRQKPEKFRVSGWFRFQTGHFGSEFVSVRFRVPAFDDRPSQDAEPDSVNLPPPQVGGAAPVDSRESL